MKRVVLNTCIGQFTISAYKVTKGMTEKVHHVKSQIRVSKTLKLI